MNFYYLEKNFFFKLILLLFVPSTFV